ncbi:amidohydrolase family protein [Aliarcobacter butzleri]|uniref:Amidohydrolase family protein n=1 Tax=Aliarcobacter butzleri TaxID=28197 RepID=A0AAW7Q1M6_9BACT|nr:amidohydrolase family protein [Aliarcobacter butzleri]MCT7615148.1 amidohydrolase family protein [Aliarcobacter butzleri]MDN5043214.1 amidohydrolase family protein [Aliarcobacter butzleri]MDN5113399.1 amidohydrolase family protein [Aliarcobacter butzleri]
MQTIDFHSHLLNPNVSFSRLYDKVAISLFAKKLGVDKNELINRKYDAFVESFINNIKTSKHIKKSVILPVDAKIDIKGDEIHRDKTVCSSNEDVYKEYQKYPNEIIPFFSINPNRKDALDLIDKYASLGFKGAKFLQNYWDIDINDKKYSKYFEKIKSYNLPIIIHSGSEYAISSNPKYEKIEVANQAIEIGCKVVLAHFGVNIIMENRLKYFHNNLSFKNNRFGDDYFKTLEYLEKHENVYADLSAVIALFRTKIVEDLAKNQKQIHHKLLFGTDYPVPFSILFSHNSLGLKKRLELEKIQNPLDRYISFFNEYFEEDSPVYNNWQKLIKE